MGWLVQPDLELAGLWLAPMRMVVLTDAAAVAGRVFSMAAQLRLDLWDVARGRMREQFGPERFERWLSELTLVSVQTGAGISAQDGRVEVGVRNSFVLSYLETNYLAPLTAIFRDLLGAEVRVSIVVVSAQQVQQLQQQAAEVDRPSVQLLSAASSPSSSGLVSAPRNALAEYDSVEQRSPARALLSEQALSSEQAFSGEQADPSSASRRIEAVGNAERAIALANPQSLAISAAVQASASDLRVSGLAGSELGVAGRSAAVAGRSAAVGVASRAAESGTSDEESCEDLRLESFVFGRRNRMAVSALTDVLERPGAMFSPLVVHGASGVGKTHLLRGLYREFRRAGRVDSSVPTSRRRSKSGASAVGVNSAAAMLDGLEVPSNLDVRYVTAEQFFYRFVSALQDNTLKRFRSIYRECDVLILDDLQDLLSKTKTLAELTHTIAALIDNGKQVILSATAAPRDLDGLDDSLVGRLLAGLTVRLERPDRGARLAILRQRAARLDTRFPGDVLDYLSDHVQGGARDLVGALNQLDLHARLDREGLDLDLARAVLADRVRDMRRRATVRRIAELVADHFATTVEELVSRARQQNVSWARHVAMYLSRELTDRSLSQIGEFFGGRKHGTVTSAVRVVRERRSTNDLALDSDLQSITEQLSS